MSKIHTFLKQQPYRNPFPQASDSSTQPLNSFFKMNKHHYSINKKHQDKTQKIDKIIESLVLPCCGQNMINTRIQNNNTITIPIVYIMPCGHNMCQKCICTILEYKTNNSISCSHRDCPRNYTFQEAQHLFVKNLTVGSFLERLLQIKSQINSSEQSNTIPSSFRNQLQNQHTTKKESDVLRNPSHNRVHFISENVQCQKKENKSSDGSSGQQVFNQCTNLFCKKPTISFFCSDHCEELINKLEQIMPTNVRIINNQLTSN